MAARILKDWVESYLKFTENTEPARQFHLWTALSVIASALRKKVYLSLGRIKIHTNMYVVFVAAPGRARKTQAISFGLDIMSKVPDIQFSADATTREALIEQMVNCAVDEALETGEVFKHSSLSIISREFESFIGSKKDNQRMLVFLTDLFDASELPWKYKTKTQGSSEVSSPYINLLGATTPDSLASSLPSSAVGGGLTSRILFIWAEKRQKKVSRPFLTTEEIQLKEHLIKDLYSIARIVGEYKMSPTSEQKWDDWYDRYDEDDPLRLCKDPSFEGWYSRKPMYILKLSVIMTSARTNTRIVEWDDIRKSIDLIESVETDMGNAFKAIGKSTITAEVDLVAQTIASYGAISEKQLMSIVWRDMDADKFDNVIQTVVRSGKAIRKFNDPNGTKGVIWYHAIPEG